MSTQTPDEAAITASIPVDETTEFDDTTDAEEHRPTGSLGGAFRAKQRFYEAMRSIED